MVLFSKTSDYWLAPIYFLQARQVDKNTLRLPEPTGERQGESILKQGDKVLKLAIFGDSAGAGVGVDTQADAPLGQIVANLCQKTDFPFDKIHWQLHATSGHTSFQLLWRLYAMPMQTIDVAIVNIGVNDVIAQTNNARWRENLHNINSLLKRKFGVRHVLFLSLPPMQFAPSLPKPLNDLIGRRAKQLSDIMQDYCQANHAHYIQDELNFSNQNIDEMFAKDGFHPSKLTYQLWSKTLANAIVKILSN